MITRGSRPRLRWFRDLGEAGGLEERPGPDVGHGEVDLGAAVVGRVALHHRRPLVEGVLGGAGDQHPRDPPAAVPGADLDAPQRPHRQVVDVRDLPRPREGQLRARGDGCPSTTVPSSAWARTPGATSRAHSPRTKSPRAGPTSSRFERESMRWLRHQQTDDVGFLGASIVATSSKAWAGRIAKGTRSG